MPPSDRARPAPRPDPAVPGSDVPADHDHVEITSEEELRSLIGEANPVVFSKATRRLGEFERAWIRHTPLVLIATAAADGTCDVSPKGDPAGFVQVLDDSTLAVPDRPGNRRLDSWRNVLQNPHIGMIFVIPGRGDTLRVNGRARLVRSPALLDEMVVKGNRPKLALLVDVEEAYFHCAKSFMRAGVWDPESWTPQAAPSRALIARSTEWRDVPLEVLEERYGADYERRLYP
ncbi:pyridoxamine 5'-phosphate oxidase family protein [Streptomyces sp. S3(2020)]|uniref:MSMEG_1061 family FMN-dependent PPOX-type flavoprotein n=1 Tax=Streptomyces sp. S3(2020) TaxID=2732044 RepID=UPI0014886604|nr:MSMEG_1061 family FMN-dependent PPOX-type flavoprotein [Streptomyces sp. S3(2020)]NNN33435.1 pyridoxamine 5'-phosphate oxidase family protein [Streptomyces sp. S3(2020)]